MKRILALLLVLALLFVPLSVLASPLDEVYYIIEHYYVEPVDPQQLHSTDLAELGVFLDDPYTSYFSPGDFRDFLDSLHGTYGGIGTVIYQSGGETIIQSVFPGSPAEKAGLLSGDVIFSVHGMTIDWLSLDIVTWLIRGAAGTEVELGIRRGSQSFTVTIVRGNIELPTVKAELRGDIGYIAIGSFSDKTPAAFAKELEKLRAANPRGFILDLRGNPGGSLQAVLEVAELLLPAGPVVSLRDRHGNQETYQNQRGGPQLPNLFVLVNSSSASGAEILAGALQDYRRGVLVGSRTFGKASVQTLFQLSDGSGLKVTTALYHTPSGQAIHKKGLTPDLAAAYYEELDFAVSRIRSATPTLVFGIGTNVYWTPLYGQLTMDAVPFLDKGRSYLPVRFLAENMGAQISWDETERAAIITKGASQIIIPAGSTTALHNGESLELLGESRLVAGRLYAPARAVAEALGGRVWWDAGRREVIVSW